MYFIIFAYFIVKYLYVFILYYISKPCCISYKSIDLFVLLMLLKII